MKRALFGLMLAVLLVGVSSRAFATTTDQLQLKSGSSTVTIMDNVLLGGDVNPTPGTINYFNGNFAGWNILFAGGSSNSPGLLPFGIDIFSLTATCNAGASCAALTIGFSDINFTQVVPSFNTSFSAIGTTGAGATTTQSAYFDTTNAFFGTGPGTLIGTVGPFTPPGSFGTASGGGPAGPGNYSLTLVDTLGGGSGLSYNVSGNITAAPEPASLTLVGTGLIGLAGLRRRKLLQA